jgi:hypothetical protein
MTRVRNVGMARHIPKTALCTAGEIVGVFIVKWIRWMGSEEKVKKDKMNQLFGSDL